MKAQRRNLETIGLVTDGQKAAAGPLQSMECVFSFDGLWSTFAEADHSGGAAGVCGL